MIRLKGICTVLPDSTVEFVAQENISMFDVVTSKGTKANSSDYNTRNIIIGFATSNVSSGFSGRIIGFGEITNAAWNWSRGDKIFLNGLGTISKTPPINTYTVILGSAISTNTIDVNIQPSILL